MRSASTPVRTEAPGFGWRYLADDVRNRVGLVSCVLALGLAAGCAGMNAPEPNPAQGYVEYAHRAARADAEEREEMKRQAEQLPDRHRLTRRLRIGFLMTSPGEPEANTQAGERILRKLLAEHADLSPDLRALVELRITEVEARQSLRAEIRDVRGKIEELMSIESAMEKKKNESQTRPR